MVPSAITQKVRNERATWEAVDHQVRARLLPFCDTHHYGFDHRVKTTQSVAEKLESGRYANWSELDDVVACAVVVPGYEHEDRVLSFLNSSFQRIQLIGRSEKQRPPETFRFNATRFYGRLYPRQSQKFNQRLTEVTFEIQVRTAFEHAWIITTHDLSYKGDQVSWRRKRLAAQLKSSIEQLDQLILGFSGSADVIPEAPWPEIENQERIRSVLARKVADGSVPSELSPGDWNRLAANLYALLRASTGGRQQLENKVKAAVDTLDLELQPRRSSNLPRSCSLWQVSVGTLAAAGVLTKPPRKFSPLITDEMRTFFPQATILGKPIDLNG